MKQGVIKTQNSSSLMMSNSTVLNNHATEYPGAIYADKSSVQITNTYFNGNTAINGGGAIVIVMSLLQINNCTFKNNQVYSPVGIGGAIVSVNNSSLDLSHSIFDANIAYLGGAIHQGTGIMNISLCSFFGNIKTAVAGLNINISIINSIFKDNLGKIKGGAVTVEDKSTLNVSNTIFENNRQVSHGLH